MKVRDLIWDNMAELSESKDGPGYRVKLWRSGAVDRAGVEHPGPVWAAFTGADDIGIYATREDAQAACQTHFNAYVMSLLEPPAPPVDQKRRHMRHLGNGLLALFDGDDLVCNLGRHVGDFRDRDRIIAGFNDDLIERALIELLEDITDREDIDSPSMNPGRKRVVRQAQDALARYR